MDWLGRPRTPVGEAARFLPAPFRPLQVVLAIERAMVGLSVRLPFLLGIALFAAGPMILGYQAIGWLVHGYWIGMPLSAFWSWLGGPYPGARLDGDELLYWLFRQPLSVVSVVTGAAVIFMSRNRV
jgi:hypothetical protein